MGGLPDLVVAIATGTNPGAVVVGRRLPDGSLDGGMARWPSPVPEGALLLHWPGSFPWNAASFAFRGEVRDRGGEVLPLTAVLGKLGLGSPRTFGALVTALDPELDGVEDPGLLGRRLVDALARRLGEFSPEDEPSLSGTVPHPEIAGMLAVLPEDPGVYAFHDVRGSVLYVGKAASLRARVPRHFGPRPPEPEKSRALADRARDLRWETTGSELEALLREQMRIRRERPALNAQEMVHERRRGAWRDAVTLCVLPSCAPGSVEVMLVAGDGRFHWERVERRARVPRGFAARLRTFLAGDRTGWGPGEPGAPLAEDDAAALAEIALSWLTRYGDRVSRIDLRTETVGRPLLTRIRPLLAEDPRGGRVEVVARPE